MIWIEEMLPKADVIQLLSHATVFACPSIYEPLGIVNLEAMACETAVVASAVGGIVEVVDDGVDRPARAAGHRRRARSSRATAQGSCAGWRTAINALVRDPDRAAAMGRAGRARAVERFAWPAIAEQTCALYRSCELGAGPAARPMSCGR